MSAASESTPSSRSDPVVMVWWRPGDAPDREWLEQVRCALPAADWVCGPVDCDGSAAIDDENGTGLEAFDSLDELSQRFPGRSLLLLRAGLALPERFGAVVDALCRNEPPAPVVVFPGDYDVRIDPLAGLDAGDADLPRLVGWCADRTGQPIADPPRECMLLAPQAVSGKPAHAGAHGALLIDDGYAHAPARGTNRRGHDQPEGWAPEDRVLGHLRWRIQSLVAEGVRTLPAAEGRPVTLHVTHSWGGGVDRFIADFSDADEDSIDLVLVAVSDHRREYCGRRLKLCAAGPGRGVIREIGLAPFIAGTVAGHAGYRDFLERIIDRFGVGRIVVSSLIGHSLDCLATGLPTVQVLHDFYPLWPLLDRDPLPAIEAAGDLDEARTRALAEAGDRLRFRAPDPAEWSALAEQWRAMARCDSVRLVAPTRHVAERWRRLAGDGGLEITRIGHGHRPFGRPSRYRFPARTRPLHLLIPGRLTAGKGLDLLREALPELREFARITALGCGRECLDLLGRSGIDLVIDYAREDLPRLVEALQPHAALLLSTVPETWSYTLSEMRALGVVPVATAVGSFTERIRDGQDGFLVAPEPSALVARLCAFAEDPSALERLAGRFGPEPTIRRMVEAYNGLSPPVPAAPARFRAPSAEALLATERAGWLADAVRRAERAEAARSELGEELERRTRWAETMERQFRARTAWARRLDREIGERDARIVAQAEQIEREQRLRQELKAQSEALERRFRRLQREHARLSGQHRALQDQHRQLQQRHESLQQQHERLQTEFEQVLASRSWRLTRPLRVAARVGRNLRARGAANPLRWPRIAARLVHHLRLRGAGATLRMLQTPPLSNDDPGVPDGGNDAGPGIPRETGSPPEPVALPRAERPAVSIVVPVHNQLHFTAACLESLAAARCATRFEVIVVDDASSDGTRAWLRRCSGIRVVRNRVNQGFIRTCNRGAGKARGRWLVFLNNDTRVADDWLDALVATFGAHPDAGIVGARLLFADGRLQEAGGIVFRDASGWNLGRNDRPDHPRYGFVAEVDYVSGACLAIEASLFAELGGFDTRYVPAYYEDTDLCFRVRERGLRVLYQPAANVVHFEGATSGTDENRGVKRHQAINRKRFRERWAETLARQPENPGRYSPELAERLRDRGFRRRALVVDAVTPMPDHDSGSVRMFALLKILVEAGYRTRFMPENLAWSGRHSRDLQQLGVEVLTSPWVADPDDWLAEHGTSQDLVMVSRHYVLAPWLRMLRKRCGNALLVFDTVDLHFLREAREAELSGSAAAQRAAGRTRKQELALVRAADATLVVSPYERDLLARLVPSARVEVVSNIHAVSGPGKPFDERADLMFVGGFQHPPNIDAADWLVDEILPRILQELPEVTLHLIGSRMPDRLARRRARGLQVHGYVEDLEPFLTGCRVSLAPLRYGAGVKGKVNQAMAHGLPVVATPCAAEGMFAEPGRDLLVAEHAAEFAEAVVRVYRERALWETLAENGQRNVEKHFSVAAARSALLSVIEPDRRRSAAG